MSKKAPFFLAVAVALTTLAAAAWAVPNTIPFQGRLTDAAGTPLNGSFSIRFSLWSLATGGAEVWNETQPTVTVTNGIFHADLGTLTALTPAILSGADRFLEIKVGADAAMTPRQHFGSTPYSFRAGDSPGVAAAHSLVGAPATGTFSLCSQAVTYPGPGVAIVTTYVAWEVDATAGVTSQSQVGISESSGAFDGQAEYFAIIPAAAPSGSYNADVTPLVRFYNIPAASTHTYFTVINRQGGNFIHHGTYMTVQYIPNTIGTVTPAPAAVPTFVAPSRASDQAQGK